MQININSIILDMRRQRRRDYVTVPKITSKLIADKTHTSVTFVDKTSKPSTLLY